MDNYKKVIGILTTAKDQLKVLLSEPEDAAHLLRIETSMQNEINRFGLLTGTEYETVATAAAKPAATLFGQKIERETETTAAELEAPKEKLEVLKEKVEGAYEEFLTKGTDAILSNMDETVIRGVAKMAGLKVTTKEPEKISSAFIEEVKEAIQSKSAAVKITAAREAVQERETARDAAEAKVTELETAKAPKAQIEKAKSELDKATTAYNAAVKEVETLTNQ